MLPSVLIQIRMMTFKLCCSPQQNIIWSLDLMDLKRCAQKYRSKQALWTQTDLDSNLCSVIYYPWDLGKRLNLSGFVSLSRMMQLALPWPSLSTSKDY